MIIISATLLSLLLVVTLVMRNPANRVIKIEKSASDQTQNFQSLSYHYMHGFSEVDNALDLVTPKLTALPCYPMSIQAPPPPKASYDAAVARCGEVPFTGQVGRG